MSLGFLTLRGMRMAAKDRQSNINARRQVQREAQECVNRYNAALHVAARATGMDYRNAGTVAAPFYEPSMPNPLGRQIPDTGRAITDGQRRASGRELAPLPRYTS